MELYCCYISIYSRSWHRWCRSWTGVWTMLILTTQV